MLFKHIRPKELNDEWQAVPSACGGKTIAVQEIQNWVFDNLTPGTSIERRIGVATCHPKEGFNKKIGREIAEKNSKIRRFTVVRIVQTIKSKVITFEVEGFGPIDLVRYSDAKQVRLV